MRNYSLSTLLLTLIAGAASAQTNIVFPSDHDLGFGNRLEGYSRQSSFPFSWGIARQMAVYEAHDLNIPNGDQITHVGFPRDGNLQSLGEAVRLQIFIGQTDRTVANVHVDFANNFATPAIEVYSVKNFTLPDLGYVTPPPLVEEVWVPLDTPFTFDSSKNLVVDYRVYANSNANQAFNYYLDYARFLSPVTAHGQGCNTSAGSLPLLQSTGTAVGSAWRLRLSNAPASATTGLHIALGLLPAPITIPGTSGVCQVLTGALAVLGGTTNTGGSLLWSLPVPNDIHLNDLSLYSQAFSIDFFANAAGIVVTNADQIQLGMNPRMAIISSRGDANATRGNVSRYWGAVSLFRHQ